ncbi:thioredoxin-like protein [Chytriomyces sp. MP71]|nr:thioredoxin-like protein [Chytriomyces sp. MP71]
MRIPHLGKIKYQSKSSPRMRMIPVTIVTDTICPWCYVGTKRFQNAVANFKQSHPDVDFQITHVPFQIEPSLPKTPQNHTERIAKKIGSRARVDQMHAHLQALGRREGIAFSFEGNISNSLDSHRLIAFAGAQGAEVQGKVVEALFRAKFEEDRDVGDLRVLLDVAEKAGVADLDGVRNMLAGDFLLKETREQVELVQRRGVHGVPHFTVDEKYVVEGAQEPSAFEASFERALLSR